MKWSETVRKGNQLKWCETSRCKNDMGHLYFQQSVKPLWCLPPVKTIRSHYAIRTYHFQIRNLRPFRFRTWKASLCYRFMKWKMEMQRSRSCFWPLIPTSRFVFVSFVLLLIFTTKENTWGRDFACVADFTLEEICQRRNRMQKKKKEKLFAKSQSDLTEMPITP